MRDDSPRILVRPPKGIPRDMVVKYISRSNASLLNLSKAVEQREFEVARVFGHHMKGSGGAFGIPELTDIGAAIEQAAKDKDSTELEKLAGELDTYLRRLEVAPS